MNGDKYKQDERVDSLLSLLDSKGWVAYKEELADRIENLIKQKDSLLAQYKDREAGEKLARQKELEISFYWVENKLKALKKESK